MNKILSRLILFGMLLTAFAGCLKDEDFDNNVYGIKDPGTPGITLPEASKPINFKSLEFLATPQVIEAPLANFSAGQVADKDIHVHLALDVSLINAYNTANGTNFEPLPASLYSISNLVVTIPKDSTFAKLKINFPDATKFDLSKSYALGITVQSVDEAGYIIASNLKNYLLAVVVKNLYDGEYTAEGYVYHPTAPRAVDEDKTLATTGANSISVGFGDLGGSGYVANVTVDPATNKLTITAAPGAAGGTYYQFDAGLPPTNPGYTPKWSGSSLIHNTYDPATKTFYLRYAYLGGSGYRVTEEIIKKK